MHWGSLHPNDEIVLDAGAAGTDRPTTTQLGSPISHLSDVRGRECIGVASIPTTRLSWTPGRPGRTALLYVPNPLDFGAVTTNDRFHF
jgi:hypothetical protein